MEVNGEIHVLVVLLPEESPGAHWVGGWVGPRTGLDAMEKRKIFCPCGESIPDSSVVQSAA
jgi:hypothetical protein